MKYFIMESADGIVNLQLGDGIDRVGSINGLADNG